MDSCKFITAYSSEKYYILSQDTDSLLIRQLILKVWGSYKHSD